MVIKNKKGQDLSIGTLILIVLGIVVLVLLILGFSLGWDNLWKKINIFGGTSSIGDIATACKLAVTSQDQYTFCTKTWEIRDENNNNLIIGCRDSKITGIDKTVFGDCGGQDYDEMIFEKECVKKKGTVGTESCDPGKVVAISVKQPKNKYCCSD